MTQPDLNDIQQRLIASFQAEHREHLEKMRSILGVLSKGDGGLSGPELEEVFRRAHSLKGAARAVNLRPVEVLAHRLETLFSRVREGLLPLDGAVLKTITAALDAIEDWVDSYLKKQVPLEPREALRALDCLLGTQEAFPSDGSPAAGPTPPSSAGKIEESVSVSAPALDRLLRTSDRFLTDGLRQDQIAREISQVASRIEEVRKQWDYLKRSIGPDLRRLASDPHLAPMGKYSDFMERQMRLLDREMRKLRRRHSRGAWEMRSLGGRLHQEVRRLRMVPAESVFQGLRKMVRDLAKDEGKEVEFLAEGLSVEADRLILQALKDPLLHLLRNAVSHGIGFPEERSRQGKNPAGRVLLSLEAKGGLLNIEVQDNGQGVDWKAAARTAVRKRFLSQEQADSAGPQELAPLLFEPGFSTSPMVTELAGRGMGLSIVAEMVRRLQGSARISSVPGQGASVTLTLPLSILTRRLLLVRCSGQTFAIPAHGIRRLARKRAGEIRTEEGRSVILVEDRSVPIANLAELIGLKETSLKLESETIPIVIFETVAAAVDSLAGEMEGVVQDMGDVPGPKTFSGAVLLEDGSAALVLDPSELGESFKNGKRVASLRIEKVAPEIKASSILVVDDSVTTRTLEKSILEAHGYRVELAVDGVEALERLRMETPDLAVVDLQMPRMDGFQLIEEMKKDQRFSKIPVIIVTSMESRKDKERGMALGAEAYILKRKFDHKGLLETIRQIL